MGSEKSQLIDHIQELEQRVYRALHPLMCEEWVHADLTMPQLKVLLLLFVEGPSRMSVLSSNMGIAMATATGIVDRLVERGLITREGHPEDRRAVICRLSPEGQELVDRLWQSGRSRGRELLENMNPAELRLVADAMEAILKAASILEQNLKRQKSDFSELSETGGIADASV
jgi:DNA-binding MarR family transcriptional regulator